MNMIETTQRTTKEELSRVQALARSSGQRLAERRQAVSAAEAARKEALLRQALGAGEEGDLAGGVQARTAVLAKARQELADELVRADALEKEVKRLHGVLAEQRAAAQLENVRRQAANVVSRTTDLENSLARFLKDYAAQDKALDELLALSPGLGPFVAQLRETRLAAFSERFSYVPNLPNVFAQGMRHPMGPRYVSCPLQGLVGTADQIVSWHQRGAAV